MFQKNFHKTSLGAVAIISAMAFAPASNAALYSQDFEAMTPDQQTQPNDLSDDGWLVGANVYDPNGVFLYNYFAFPAPNGGDAFSAVVTGEGGVGQGDNQLSVYSDYNNVDHAVGNLIEAVVFNDVGTIGAEDLGTTITFSFDAKQGNQVDPSTSTAYIKVLDTLGGSFVTLGEDVLDTTGLGTDWSGGELSLLIDDAWLGQTLQIGFTNTATNYDGSGVFYDNLNVSTIPVPAAVWLFGSGLLGLVGVARRRKS
jgi:hypothetical protein